ncbi:MAG: hypothetical protein NTV98_01515 [Candidatus Roizmanbacteria bacterium]|nr:hypothetical protein [Candidatus Roizmanbacteria bacterium]
MLAALKNNRLEKIIFILFLLSLGVRFYFLFFGFGSITNDEADYYLTSYLFAKTGTDQFGHTLFFSSGFLNAISSVPVYIGALFFKILPIKSILLARLPFALLNSLTPVLFFTCIYFFSNSILYSLIGFGIFNFSPWFSHLSATAAFDSPLSLLFFLGAVNSFCYIKKPIWLKYGLFIFFNFLAFNSYMGFKTIFPFLSLLFLLLYFYSQKNKLSLKQIGFWVIFSVFIFVSFFTISLKGPGGNLFSSRATKTIVFLNKNLIENEVWYANLTTNNKVVRKLFNNKAIAPLQLFMSKYANVFNPAIYFFAEPHIIYGLRIMGLFFVTDIFFFAIGLFFGFQTLTYKMKALILGLLCIAPIPAALQIEGLTVALRGIFLLPAISLVIACGYHFLIIRIKNKLFYIALILLFVFNICSFFALYQSRIKTISAESWGGSQKMVIEDLNHYKNNKIHIYTNEGNSFLMLYGMYNEIANPQSLKSELIKENVDKYVYENITIHFSCEDILKESNEGYIVFDVKKCPSEYKVKKAHFKTLKEYYSLDKSGDLLYILAKSI